MKICNAEGCDRPMVRFGYCSEHHWKTNDLRTCRRCGERKPANAFAQHPSLPGERIRVCRECRGRHLHNVLTSERPVSIWEAITPRYPAAPTPEEYRAHVKRRLRAGGLRIADHERSDDAT
jgi:hypothetical protein